jgi:hypothetical protein
MANPPLDQQPAEIVGDEVDRFGVAGVFVGLFGDIALDHVVKDLEDVAQHPGRLRHEHPEEFLEGNGLALLALADAAFDLSQNFLDVVHVLFHPLNRRA